MDACIHWVRWVLCVTRDGKRAERGQASTRPTWGGTAAPVPDCGRSSRRVVGGLERAKKGRTEGGRVWRAWGGVARDGRSGSGRCGADWERLRAAVRAGEEVSRGGRRQRGGGVWPFDWAPRESLRRGDGEVSWTTRLCGLSGYLLRGRAGLVRSDGGLPGGDVERAASGEDGVGREARGKEKGKRDGMGGTCGWRSGARMDGWHGSLRSRPVRGSGRRWTGGGGCS